MISKHLQALLFDMDGVLYNSEVPIPGAAEAVNWASRRGIPHLFVTNTSSRGRAALVEKLARFGIASRKDQILNPGSAAAAWLKTQPPGNISLFLKLTAREEFDGLSCLPDNVETGASYVVIGDLGESWDFATLNRAFRLLQSNPQARLVALGMTRYWQRPDGLALDVAPFVAALEHATGRQAVVLGKPAAAFFQTAAQRFGVPPESIIMIGDDIYADIAGAQAAGLKTALVQTGKFRSPDLESGVQPDLVLHSIADLPGWWGA